MGILVNALSITLGSLIGSIFKAKVTLKDTTIYGIGVMILSAAGAIENLFVVEEGGLSATYLLFPLAALIIGYLVGEWLHIDQRLSNISAKKKNGVIGAVEASLFFGIGGMQISGPMLLALENDSSQLFIKSIVDFPFALMFGAIYGMACALASLPVALVQVVIAIITFWLGGFINHDLLCQFCFIGYLILFFSGYNMLGEIKHKIKNMNMLPSFVFLVIFYVLFSLLGGL